jgi:hypothetical protein
MKVYDTITRDLEDGERASVYSKVVLMIEPSASIIIVDDATPMIV